MALQPGQPYPLGAHWDGVGVNFAVVSDSAERIELCLFGDGNGDAAEQRLVLPARSGDVWHGRLPAAAPGLVYGLRAHGPWRPEDGQRFNPAKLLLDPWAREIVGRFEWRAEHGGFDPRDNAAHALKARVVVPPEHDGFDWQGDRPPEIAAEDSVLYELHVRGFTMRHPGVPAAERGTYAGLASDAAIAHFKRLGVTSLSLLPVHQHLDEQRLVQMGLTNYWGYNTIGFFSPEPTYAQAGGSDGKAVRDEFRTMVRTLHAAGLEVLIDVVFNHSAETDEHGPTLSWRGLDNALYYRLRRESRALYENDTGCGNTFDLRRPRVVQMVLDSLLYWVQAMHVDGFRFDLAPVLGRGNDGFERDGAFFTALRQDPVLAGVKLIAEPWDIGPGGYQLGSFPAGWLEWNDRFRDTVRGVWLAAAAGDAQDADRAQLARRLAGSSDLFMARRRSPAESVNYVVSHDGFCLRDLLSYEQRRNQANGEDNRDGHGHNLGWNCGAEGDSDNPVVRQRRDRLSRSLIATLLFAQGTPMLAAGMELGHTQHGNNNPYCQDNPTSWIDWSQADQTLLEFTARAVALRRRLLPLGSRWYNGSAGAQGEDGDGEPDLRWLLPDGRTPAPADWHDPAQRTLCLRIGRPGRSARPLLLLLNPQRDDTVFTLPPGRWRLLLDSADDAIGRDHSAPAVGATLLLRAHGLALLEAMA